MLTEETADERWESLELVGHHADGGRYVLESYDFSGKTIVPYCTHEGSGLGSSERDIKKLCPTAKLLSGLAFKGSTVARADDGVVDWLIGLLVLE